MTDPDLDYARFDALTFDCYGTLIDWEAGILAALPAGPRAARHRPARRRAPRGVRRDRSTRRGGPYQTLPRDPRRRRPRRRRAISASNPTPPRSRPSRDSVGDWPAFPDSLDALARLHERFRLGVITNCDDDLFARSAARLGTDFDWVVTAQQAGVYKPRRARLRARVRAIGLPGSGSCMWPRACTTTTSPAKRLGLTTVWIDRRHGRPGSGATPPAEARHPTRPSRTWPRSRRPRPPPRNAAGASPSRRGCGRASPRPRAERLPAAMLDLDAGRPPRRAATNRISTSVASARSRAEVPQVDEPVRRLPDRDLAPVVLDRRPPSARRSGRRTAAPGRPSGRRLAGHGVVGRPPLVEIRPVQTSNAWSGGQSTSKASRIGSITGSRSGVVFSATSRKRAAASPQTRSR